MATQNIGVLIDLTKGTHTNTEYKDGKISLKEERKTYDLIDNVYSHEGVWVSEQIDLVDKYTSLENLAISKIINGKSTYKAYTRTSDNAVNWDDYVEISFTTGKIMSVPKRYIQVKIEFLGLYEYKQEIIHNFTELESAIFDENEYVQFDGALYLKRDYEFKMGKDNNWTEEGTLFRRLIKKSELKKIDSLNFKEQESD